MLHFFHPGGKANHITFIIASGIDAKNLFLARITRNAEINIEAHGKSES